MQSPQKRSVNPGKMQSNHIQPMQAQFQKKSHVNIRLQVQSSKYKRDTKYSVTAYIQDHPIEMTNV